MNVRSAKLRQFVVSLLMVGTMPLWAGAVGSASKAPPSPSPGPETAPGPALSKPAPAPDSTDGKVRIICFGAHPDDDELSAGGVAALWAARGHHVKFVSCTNGDIGHWGMAGGPLAQRRTAEVQRCAEIFGIETQVLDIHDGELLPTMENRRTIVRLIRQWRADIVMCHRSNDYHPDHRNVGLLVQDAGYMVTVPFFCPDTPYLKRNPVFLYYEDGFQKPNPFSPDIVVAIDEVVEKKLAAAAALESQFAEGGCNGGPDLYPPNDPQKRQARQQEVRRSFERSFAQMANRFRKQLVTWYGQEQGAKVRYAEAFEICEYGRQPSKKEIRELFPFFPAP
jgi:LmbE family N-acetylglucosaminyl deacetylase